MEANERSRPPSNARPLPQYVRAVCHPPYLCKSSAYIRSSKAVHTYIRTSGGFFRSRFKTVLRSLRSRRHTVEIGLRSVTRYVTDGIAVSCGPTPWGDESTFQGRRRLKSTQYPCESISRYRAEQDRRQRTYAYHRQVTSVEPSPYPGRGAAVPTALSWVVMGAERRSRTATSLSSGGRTVSRPTAFSCG